MASYAAVFLIRAVDAKRLISFRLGAASLLINVAIIAAQICIMLFVSDLLLLIIGQAVCVTLIVAINARAVIRAVKPMLASLRG